MFYSMVIASLDGRYIHAAANRSGAEAVNPD
jgi:hypothetical protein